ncbi:hypothetical protein ACH6EH_06645 [Paenibacillus sp. JSM ZJ436]|uniref:hypothetical protein n=1 Tax=Paenibacillus sp. JSM ZJ436 TaxID=3376190 RepID=UPI0037A06BC3
MTTYDSIFTQFIAINKTDPINIPTSDEGKYNMIHSAIVLYNNRMRDEELGYDDTIEQVNRSLSHDEILIVSRYMRLTFLENQLTEFATLYQPFAADIGLRNYQSQVKALQTLIDNENSKIERIIDNMQVDYL